MESCLLFDLDGTVRPPPMGEAPVPPPRPLGRILRRLSQEHLLGAATGAGLESARATEAHLALRFGLLSVSYCARLIRRGGHLPSELCLVPEDQKSAMGQITPALDRIREENRGALDDRGIVYTMFLPAGSQAFNNARDQVAVLVGDNPRVRFLANPDGGITVMPAHAGKALITRFVREQMGRTILVGAGDTGSDLPLIEAAAFPIVTRTSMGAAVHPALAQVVADRGVGYIAKENEPHGFGLLAGLYAARDQGVLTF